MALYCSHRGPKICVLVMIIEFFADFCNINLFELTK